MSSHYQSLSLCNESFLVFWSKRWTNPHLSQPSVSDSASYNLDLNPCPLGPQTLQSCWICSATEQVILIPRALEPPAHTLTAPLKHLRLQSDILCQSWVLLGLLAQGHWVGEQLWCLGGFDAWLRLPPPYPPPILLIKHVDCVTTYAGQCLIAKAQQEPSFALSV